LPNGLWLAALAIAFMLALQPDTRRLALVALAVAWSAWVLQSRLDNRVSQAFEHPAVSGQVTSLPVTRGASTEFHFRLHHPERFELQAPATLLVRWHQPGVAVHSGQHLQLPLRVRPPRGRLNFQGSDIEAWLFAQNLAGTASVRSGPAELLETAAQQGLASPVPRINRLRERLRTELSTTLQGHPGLGLVLALAIADRSQLAEPLQQAMVITGTGHLLAISGMHIGMVAVFSFWLGRILLLPLAGRCKRWPVLLLGWLAAFPVAAAYAALAGFATSTQRALVMLAVATCCVLSRRRVPAYQALLVALVLVLLLDPAAPASAGFWLSFGAVLVLVYLFTHRSPAAPAGLALPTAQVGIGLVMLPLGLYWFQRMGAGGLLANLFAIPWVTLVTLPLTLLATATAGQAAVGEILAWMAADAAWWAAQALQAMAERTAPVSRMGPAPGAWLALLATLAALALCLPRAIKLRWLALLVYLPMLLLPVRQPAAGSLQLDLLDVGQGLAVVVSGSERSLLYDTGPGEPGRWDLYEPVLAPALAGLGRAPVFAVASHADLDHAGGVQTLQAALPGLHWLASLPQARPGLAACHDQRHWQWQGVHYRVLHPSPWLPYLGNNSSCVLSVRSAGHSILLPGDIDALAERRLVGQGLQPHNVLVSAHHGSRSSTSAAFLDALQPRWVLTAAGQDNRFGFPHAEVNQRLEARGVTHWNSADCGALRLLLPAEGPAQAWSARRERPAIWRWPASPNCP
jgi:competence protein ComEC